jgi:hypothetical protein
VAASDAFYNGLIPEITGLLAEYGTTFTVRAAPIYNDATMRSTLGTERAVKGVIVDSATKNNLASQIYPVGEASQGWFTTRGLILEPAANLQPEDEVLVDGQWFPVGKTSPLKPADVTLLYIVALSK